MRCCRRRAGSVGRPASREWLLFRSVAMIACNDYVATAYVVDRKVLRHGITCSELHYYICNITNKSEVNR
jgi:hypothetical protein